MIRHIPAFAALALALPAYAQDDEADTYPSPNEIVAQAPASDWVTIPAEDLLVMTLAPAADGTAREVVIQLMPAPFSEAWTANIRTLARARWYDGVTINRVQDNYVVQWGDPNVDNPEGDGEAKPLPSDLAESRGEDYTIAIRSAPFLRGELGPKLQKYLSDTAEALRNDAPYRRDSYTGFTTNLGGWPVALGDGKLWPVHCYGMVGVGRSYAPDAGSGAELYAVIGHAPRHLDRNIALVGRVIEGIEHLSSLPRGSGELGFYTEEETDKRTPIQSVRVVAGLAAETQPRFEYLSTESATFAAYAEARANRRDPWFIRPAGGADICNIPVPIRRVPEAGAE